MLALIACLGLAQLGHETTPALAQLFFATHMLYGVAAMPYQRRGATFALVVGAVGMSLSGAPTIGMALGLGSAFLVAMMLLRPEGLFPSRQRARELHTAAGEDSMEGSPEGIDAEGTLA